LPEASQNWFAKFLHLKPATSVIVMQASKASARKEIAKILRDWRKFGIRDVAVEKRQTGDVIRARVDTANCEYKEGPFWGALTCHRFAHQTCTVSRKRVHCPRTRQICPTIDRQVHSREGRSEQLPPGRQDHGICPQRE